jgi:hypothetical protein
LPLWRGRGWRLIACVLVKNPRVASDRTTTDAYAARCHCGTSLAEGTHRVCVGDAASHHSARVEVRANLLLSRLRAIHLMGTINGELQPLSTAR